MENSLTSFREILSELGFTNYEIKILIELYTNGPAKADEIATATSVPLARTYETLDSLENKQFIIVRQGRPRVYIAKNPQEAIDSIIKQERTKFNEQLSNFTRQANSLLEFAQDIYLQNYTLIAPDELLSQFSSLEEAEKYTISMIKSAKKTIKIFSHVFHWFDLVKTSLDTAISDRNCKVQVLMQSDSHDGKVKTKDLENIGIEVKVMPKSGIKTRGTIIDGSSVIFVIWASEGSSNSEKRIYRPHYSSNQGIVNVFKGYFTHLWEQS